ncbi:MAG TPA: hypothetical protein VKI44_09025 [Acetobacteraceae bacterium]|nr:hypothetical protein [Acetobacteraceae bacterium]
MTPAEQYAEETRNASRLLQFILSEGYPYHIPDEIIEAIEAARQLVSDGKSPTPEQWAKLIRAHRDLVNIPAVSITFDRIPPTVFWSGRSPWLWSLLLIAAVMIVASVVLYFAVREYLYLPLAVGPALIVGLWGLYVFTGVASNSKLNQMIRFCYVFTVAALACSILPFAIPNLGLNPPPGILRGCALGEGLPNDVKCGSNNDNYQWVINIGGVRDPFPQTAGRTAPSEAGAAPLYQVRGGIVVPLYVVVLALFGSAVSMTRRVPEYQRRAMDSQDSLTNVDARENLVFQIMQVLSAPLIGITAYYVFAPSTRVAAVLVGFGSGFASEPILLMIRSLVEKLSPAGSEEAQVVSVRVSPAAANLKPKEAQQFTAKVIGSPNPAVTWHIDPPDASSGTISQSGHYIAPAELPGKTVTVTAFSAADRTKSSSASITVEPAPAA